MIEVVTYGTDIVQTKPLLDSLRMHGWTVTHLGAGKAWNGFGDKLIAMRDYCAGRHPEQLVMFLDAYDVLVVGPPDPVEALYREHYAGQIIFNAEKNCWPDAALADEYPPSDSPWCFLNSGCYLGPAGAIHQLLAEMDIHPTDDDQRLMTDAYLAGKVTLDTACRIFQSAAFAANDELCAINRRLENAITGTCPTILHGNGRTDMARFRIKRNLEEEAALYENTAACHRDIVDRFTRYVDECAYLKAHRDYVEQHGYGYGERAFHWMWHLIVDAMPHDFRFLEIGVFKGQVPSLVTLAAQSWAKRAHVTGIGRFDEFAGITDKFPHYPAHSPADIQALYAAFDLSMKNTLLIEGDSTDEAVHDRIRHSRKFDVIYIDGCHEYEYVKRDLQFYTTRLNEGGLLVVDDAACDLKQPWGYFQGIESVTRAIREELGDWTNVLTVMHNRIFRKD